MTHYTVDPDETDLQCLQNQLLLCLALFRVFMAGAWYIHVHLYKVVMNCPLSTDQETTGTLQKYIFFYETTDTLQKYIFMYFTKLNLA